MENSCLVELDIPCAQPLCSGVVTIAIFGYDGDTVTRVVRCPVCDQDTTATIILLSTAVLDGNTLGGLVGIYRGSAAPTDINAVWLDENYTPPRLKIYESSAWNDMSDYLLAFTQTLAEVVSARGSTGHLDSRLDGTLNEDGTPKILTSAAAWWQQEIETPNFRTTSTFDVAGDKTATYVEGRAVQLTQSADGYAHVLSSVYNGTSALTVVTLDSAALDTGLSIVEFGPPVENLPLVAETHDATLLDEQVSDPTTTANQIALYAKDIAGVAKLLLRLESNGSIIDLVPTATPTANRVPMATSAGTLDPGWIETPEVSWLSFPTGFIAPILHTETPPSGWLECNGAAVSRTTYSALFAVVGTWYGAGNGSTTFNLPDLRGKFLRGWAHGSANDPDRATRTSRGDGTAGDHVGTNQADEYRSHTHALPPDGGSSELPGTPGDTSTIYGTSSSSTGYSGGNETRPININTMWCIKT